MKNFSQMITEPNVRQDADTNEMIIGALFAASCLAYTIAPVLIARAQAKKNSGGGMSFWDFLSNRLDKRKEDKEKKKQEEASPKNNEMFHSLLMISKKANEKEKDENAKKKNDAMLKLITASAFDKDGNEVPLDKIADNMKDTMSPEQFEAFKKDMVDTYEKNKDNQDFKDALVKAKANIKPEEYDKMLEEAKAEAKSTLEQIEKEKKEIEEHEKQLKDMEDEINGGDEKDKEIRELKKQLEELKNNPPQTLASTASGVNAGGTPSNTGDGDGDGDGDGEVDTTAEEKDLADKTKAAEDAKKAADDAEKELEDLNKELEGKDKDSDEYKDIQNKIKEKEQSVNELKKAADDAEKAKAESQKTLDDKKKGDKPQGEPQGEPAKKPEDYSNEEIDAMQDELSDLDPEKDKDKIKEKEDLLKSIAKAKGKGEEDFLPKNETDSEGRQVQRKTGPRGGKYFRVKTDEGWGTWQSDTNESLHQFMYDIFY